MQKRGRKRFCNLTIFRHARSSTSLSTALSFAMTTALAPLMSCVPRGGVSSASGYTHTRRASCFRPRGVSPLRRGTRGTPPRASPDDALLWGSAITDYVPSPLDTSALQSQGIVLLTVGVMTAYWWYVLVPGARVNLAVNKKNGKLKEYLVELKGDDSRSLERFFYAKWLAKVDPETRYLLRDEPDLFKSEVGEGNVAISSTATSTKKKQKVTLADTEGVTRDVDESLSDIIRKAKKTPNFWSFDNPVLLALCLTVGAGAVAGAFHR